MKKRIILVHGWGGNPNEAIHKWLKEQLEKKGFMVIAPQMPNTDEPKIEEWIPYLEKVVGKLDENTYFIGHSIGCQTIMRYLQTQNKKAGGALFIAGWFNLADMEDEKEEKIAHPWITQPINFDKIKKNTNKISVFISSNEPYGYVTENSKTFKEKLGAQVIIEKNKGHFTEEDGVVELPSALKVLLEMLK